MPQSLTGRGHPCATRGAVLFFNMPLAVEDLTYQCLFLEYAVTRVEAQPRSTPSYDCVVPCAKPIHCTWDADVLETSM